MNRPVILSTCLLKEENLQKLELAGIDLTQREFVSYSIMYDNESFEARLLNTESQARVFTSKASVYSLGHILKSRSLELIPKKTFSVGQVATQMLAELGISVAARSNNALSLAQIIARNTEIGTVDFFCGTETLNDLPEYLESKGISVHREEVFKIDMHPATINTEKLDGIIFLTPSAVFSFFRDNKVAKHIPIFCIGETTAEAVHYRCENQRILAERPDEEGVVTRLIEYFTKIRTGQ